MASYWDLPHPGVASEWKGPSDKPDQAAPKAAGDDERKGPGDKPDQAATDAAATDKRPLDESSTAADEDIPTAAAAVDIEVASDTAGSIEVTVAEAEPTTEHSSPTDSLTDSPKRVSDIVDVPVEGSADSSVDDITVHYYSADTSKVSKQSVKATDGTGSAVDWLLQDDTVPANVKGANDPRDGSIEVHVHQDLL